MSEREFQTHDRVRVRNQDLGRPRQSRVNKVGVITYSTIITALDPWSHFVEFDTTTGDGDWFGPNELMLIKPKPSTDKR